MQLSQSLSRSCSRLAGESPVARVSSQRTLAGERASRHVAAQITRGRQALRSMRMRVSGGMMLVGLCICTLSTWLHIIIGHDFLLSDKLTYCDALLWGGHSLALVILGLAPLPDDRVLMCIVLLLQELVVAGQVATVVFHLCSVLDGSTRTDELFAPRHWVSVYLGLCGAVGLVFMLGTLFALAPSSPRISQARMWRNILFFFAANAVVDAGNALAWKLTSGATAPSAAFVVGDLLGAIPAAAPGLREAVHSCVRRLFQRHQATAAAAGIASLVGQCEVKEVLSQATSRFRTFPLKDLREEDIADNAPNSDLMTHTNSCRLGNCDAFISHSWHDDPKAKWRALQNWRLDFVEKHGREPVVWFDKCCIDQTSIELDLMCLPVFLCGCKRLVLLAGNSYLSRLWCVIELFTFVHMGGEVANIDLVPLLRDGARKEDRQAIGRAFETFDASSCECYQSEDKERMLLMICTAFSGLGGFNDAVRLIVGKVGRTFYPPSLEATPLNRSLSSASRPGSRAAQSEDDGIWDPV